MTIDWTINLPFMASAAILLVGLIRNFDKLTTIATDHEKRLTKVEEVTDEHHDWLVGANLDRRTGPDRRS